MVSDLRTDRLVLRRLHAGDAGWILRLLNTPGWLRFIGDRGVHTIADAERYIADGPVAMYARYGFGLYAVERRSDGAPLGLCGLLRRDGLDAPDLGFAFFAEFGGQGYAFEAARAALDDGVARHGLTRVLAITLPDNTNSIRLLERLGLRFEGMVTLDPSKEPLRRYATGAAGIGTCEDAGTRAVPCADGEAQASR